MILWEHFDSNEWFVLVMLIVSYAAVIWLPKRVPTSLMILGLVWGFSSSTLFDFTIGGGLMDFYRVDLSGCGVSKDSRVDEDDTLPTWIQIRI
jgi:hypothetical protein